MEKKHLVIFSGAGMSAESGLKTFRDNDGLWENYAIEEVATPQAWKENKKLVLEFYNMRRKQLLASQPNNAHYLIKELEQHFEVSIITQNIDDLHERAGSSNVLHLHGELLKVKSERYDHLVYPWEKADLNLGDLCEEGFQLRPFVVWFGEEVPALEKAIPITSKADILLVIGTSLNVYPAANLVHYAPHTCECFLIDPNPPTNNNTSGFTIIQANATEGMKILTEKLLHKKGGN